MPPPLPETLYAQHFGLSQDPFSIAPDPRYLYMSERHREALAHLLYGVGGGGGFVLLSGEIGTGKTTVCRCFLEQIPENCDVAYIFNPKLTALELLQSICDEFGVDHPQRSPGAQTARDCIDPLNAFLLANHASGRTSVLIIDEAQNLSAEVLEQLRLLTNLETSERKLLQIVLIGQPELRTLLARPELEQLAQRVIARFHLDALSENETRDYIGHRLSIAGLTGANPFDPKAMARIHRLTHGVPRRINLLCGRALLGAFATGKSRVDTAIVDKAAGEVFDVGQAVRPSAPRERVVLLALGLVAGATLVAALSWGLREPRGASPAVLAVAPSQVIAPARLAPPAPEPNAPPPVTGMAALLAEAPRDPATAWRDLAILWQWPDSGADPCATAAQRQLACFEIANASLAMLRQFDRPAILTLHDVAERPVYAVMSGMGDDTILLRAGGAARRVPLAMLAGVWRGEYATFWRLPPGYAGKMIEGSSGPAVDWLAIRMASLDGVPPPREGSRFGSTLKQRVFRFQQANELPADGRAGPLTLMRLNRLSGVDEPRLLTAPN